MQIDAVGIANLAATEPAAKPRTVEAAREFEALLIAQMLRTARETGAGGWLGSGDGGASGPALEFAEQQLAALMSKAGGLGLAAQVASALGRDETARSDHKE